MKIGNVNGRLALVQGAKYVDVATASDGRFGPDPQSAYERWAEFVRWASEAPTATQDYAPEQLRSPAPRPGQVFAIGLNYAKHAAEAKLALPEIPATFTKFPACITGPYAEVELPSDSVDFEVELVVVIGADADHVGEAEAWKYVAGVSVGQDLSERPVQRSGPAPQFSLGKSFRGFGPIGPYLVTVDELENPDDLRLSCTINGETMQDARTADMIFSVGSLIAQLSSVCTLHAGDVIFTGTPAGVGSARRPQRFLRPNDVLESTIEGVGSLRNTFRPASVHGNLISRLS